MDNTSMHKEVRKTRWLPYIIALMGSIIAIISWRVLIKEDTSVHFIDSLSASAPWIALCGGIFASLLIALIVRLTYLTQERAELIYEINQEFQKEMAERIRTEETKQKLEKALLQGQKLQAIGTLAGGIAHDFNNLLYAIIGYVDMAREDVEKDSLIHQNLGKVLEAANRGRDLIGRILAFSRRQHHELQSICLKETIEGALALLKPTIPASVNLDYKDTTRHECIIWGNQTQLHQVIVNIINNAVDAMDGEGTIEIRLSQVSSHDEILRRVTKMSGSNYCKITISDTGHGMDQATLSRIFEPFFTTKEVGKGTGLGLATVHAIIEEHEGEIIVESQLGHGTTFTILLSESKEVANGKNTIG